jgi:HPt (histidine-containing phosphotransfer) domain-containing protein
MMAKAKSDTPAVTTYADHEVIQPPNKLKKAVAKAAPGNPGAAHEDAIARAEAALADLATEFSTWMDTECERLDQARHKVKKQGLAGAVKDELFRAAHDIKGEAETFGFPHAGQVAESLCRLIEHTPDSKRVPISLIEQHVDAVRAIIREIEIKDADKTATKLVTKLRQVTDEFLRYENRDRPDYLEGILAPPLAPGDPLM